MKTNPAPRPPSSLSLLIAALLLAPLVSSAQAASGGSPATPAASAAADDSPDITLYRLDPQPANSADVAAALAVADRELERLERVNTARRGPPREDGEERIKVLKAKRKAVGASFSQAGWDDLVRGIFLAMETERIARTKFDDASLWNLSRNPAFLEAGQATVNNLCAPCHLPTLRGAGAGTEAFGPDLTDTKWLHGGLPTEIYEFITHGAFTKGMPPWGSIIGAKKVTEVAAVVLSKHKEGEPILKTTDPRPPVPSGGAAE